MHPLHSLTSLIPYIFSFPRKLQEEDANGRVVHYSPYSPSGGKNYAGPLVTDNGFWDTFRTVYPLLSLLYPGDLPPSTFFPPSPFSLPLPYYPLPHYDDSHPC